MTTKLPSMGMSLMWALCIASAFVMVFPNRIMYATVFSLFALTSMWTTERCGCGRQHQIFSGGEVACCPCECGDPDYEHDDLIHEGGSDEHGKM